MEGILERESKGFSSIQQSHNSKKAERERESCLCLPQLPLCIFIINFTVFFPNNYCIFLFPKLCVAFFSVKILFFLYRGKKRTFPPPSLSLSLFLSFLLSSYKARPLSFIARPSLFRVHIHHHIPHFSCFPRFLQSSIAGYIHLFCEKEFPLLFDRMSSKKMKGKGVVLDSTTPNRAGANEDDRARLKYQALMQDYHELQKDVDITRSRLELGKQRKMALDAEVRFLRKRFRYIVKTKNMNSSQKEKLVQPLKQTKQSEKRSRKEATLRMLPPIPEIRPKKKQYISKAVALHGTSSFSHHNKKMSDVGKESSVMISGFDQKVRVDMRKNNLIRKKAPFFDLNKKERTYANDTAPSNTSPAFDLNQDGSFSGRDSSLPSRAPIFFDLNEISTGDDDFQPNAEETRSSLLRQDEGQNEMMLSVCRNAGQGQSRVGKRKISWQDPVALRV